MTADLTGAFGHDVFVSGHKKVGRIAGLVREDPAQAIVAFDVEYGMLRHHTRRVGADHVKWVNPKNVVLDLSVEEFKALPEQEAPAARPQPASTD